MFPYRSVMDSIRIIGLDPSLVACGWGVVEAQGLKLRHIAHGVIKPNPKAELHLRLRELYETITDVIRLHDPSEAAVEEAFMKNNAASAIKLGHARAACLLAGSMAGLGIGEYAPRSVKKSVVGTGHGGQSPSRAYDECAHARLRRQSRRRSGRAGDCGVSFP